MKKSTSSLILVCIIFSAIALFPQIVTAQTNSSNPIYICADGSVEGTDAILRVGDLYSFTADVVGSITIEKNNVVLDGAGFSLKANSDVFTIEGKSNVTIQNLAVVTSGTGMMLNQASGCKVLNVTIEAERAGIRARNLTYSTIANSRIEAKVEYCLALSFSSNNVVANNTIISGSIDAINCGYSQNNIISGNNIVYKTSQFSLAAGIEFDGSTNCTISANNISDFPMAGINLQGYSDNNKLEANQVINCSSGIRISGNQNNLTANYVANNSGAGISLNSASNNLLRSNKLSNNSQNFAVGSYSVAGWINDVDTSNTVDGKPIIYWVNQAGKIVPSNSGYIALVNCTGVTVQNQNFTSRGDSVFMAYTANSTITKNSASKNSTIHLYSSSANNITENAFTNNDKGLHLESSCFNNLISSNNFTGNNYGIFLSSSSSNTITENNFVDNLNALYFSSANSNNIYLNNFVNNTRQVGDSGMNNVYGSVSPTINPQSPSVQPLTLLSTSVKPVNFIGPLPLSANNWDNGAKGNFWSDYNGTDANGDGIGDTAYYLYGNNQDSYPLMQPVSVIPEFTSAMAFSLLVASAVVLVVSKRKTRCL